MTEGLGIRSAIIVPLEVAGTRRGVFLASSARPNFFTDDDVRFLEGVSRWVGMVAQRVELTERIATLAHDLGNLLVPAKGRVDLIQRRARREDRQRDLRDVGEAGRAVDRVVSLVADLLDSSRLEQGLFALNRQPADLVDLVRETCATLATNTVPIRVDVSRRTSSSPWTPTGSAGQWRTWFLTPSSSRLQELPSWSSSTSSQPAQDVGRW